MGCQLFFLHFYYKMPSLSKQRDVTDSIHKLNKYGGEKDYENSLREGIFRSDGKKRLYYRNLSSSMCVNSMAIGLRASPRRQIQPKAA